MSRTVLKTLIILTVCFCAASLPLAAQNIVIRSGGGEKTSGTPSQEGKRRVSGTIVEAGKRGTPLSLSKVYAYTPEGERAARTVTLDDGVFHLLLADGKYELRVECTGHKTKKLSVEVKGKNVDMGSISLEVGEELSESSVSAKTLLRRRGTRITYDVASDPDAAKLSMSAMAEKIPGLKLSARNGDLEYDMQKIGRILINGETNGLINAGRQYPMEFIKAHYMRKIEIVMPGDLEYNNSAPIMLITLAKELPYGFAANLQAKSDTKNNHSPGADAVINTPLIGAGVGYSYSYAGAPALSDETFREMDDKSIESKSTSRSESSGHSFNTNLFRKFFKDKVSFNASLRGSFAESLSSSMSVTDVYSPEGVLLESNTTESTAKTSSPFRLSGAFRFSGKFGKPVHKGVGKNMWKVEYGYNNRQRNAETDFAGIGIQSSDNGTEEHRVNAVMIYPRIVSNPVSLSLNMKSGYYNRHYTSNSAYLGQTDGLDYRQEVAYFDFSFFGSAFDDKLQYSANLNNEYLGNKGTFYMGDIHSPLDYTAFNVNPFVELAWEEKRFRAATSYSRRVARPAINQLNPYVDRSNPYYLRTGNPELQGQNNNNVSLKIQYTPAIKWIKTPSLTASWYGSNNAIASIVNTDDSGVATSTYANIAKNNTAEIRGSVSFWPTKTLRLSLYAGYGKTWVMLPGGGDNSFASPSARLTFDWRPEWFTIFGMFNLRPSVNSVQSSQLIMEPQGELSISRYFAKPHIGVSASVTDIFHSGGKLESVLSNGNFTERSFRERVGRTFGLMVYWRFGRFRNTETVDVGAYDMQ